MISPVSILAPPVPAGTVRLRENRRFLLFLGTRIAATSAAQMLSVALGWRVYELTGKVLDLGLIGLWEFLPRLILLIPAGAAADRFDRGRVLVCTRLLQGTGVAVLAWGSWSGGLGRGALFALAALLGAARTFEMPATMALLPSLVPAKLLPRALAANGSTFQGSVIVAPALAGFLYALGSGPVFALASFLFFAGVALTFPLIGKRRAPAARVPGGAGMRTLFAGIHYIFTRRDILGAVTLDLFAVLLGGATALLPAIAKDILHAGPWALGLLRSAPAIGAFVASVWLARHPPRRRVGARMFIAVAVYGVATLAFGLSGHFWPALTALVVMGAADMVSVVIRASLVQLETPDSMRGRVSAAGSLFIGASNQLGEFESGVTAGWFGVQRAVMLGGLGTLAVAAIWSRAFPTLARRDAMSSPPAPAVPPVTDQ
jgi:MFS family permease